MPVVILRTEHAGQWVQWFRNDLIAALPGIIAPALGVKDDEIILAPVKHYPPHDGAKNGKDFEIYVVLDASPERMQNLDERARIISLGVREFLDGLEAHNQSYAGSKAEGFVWLLPVNSAFAKI